MFDGVDCLYLFLSNYYKLLCFLCLMEKKTKWLITLETIVVAVLLILVFTLRQTTHSSSEVNRSGLLSPPESMKELRTRKVILLLIMPRFAGISCLISMHKKVLLRSMWSICVMGPA